MNNFVAQIDIDHLAKLRENVESFMADMGSRFARSGTRLLDVAPQDHKGAKPYLPVGIEYHTLDIDPNSGATYIADLCSCALTVGYDIYDFIVCTEVLEHTRQPFDAVNSIHAMLKKGGLAFISTPLNFRIHGPLPDCWRFTEHGLRELFKSFEILELNALESTDRFLMPIQYTLIARK
ncbi:MAG: class I SAM-dependent methyltransferase [Giesbergeria sp.]|nr:class I SAM-dependent methyltransferase [Giesbergeria sp.]